MMLPGVELARKRRVHHHGDAATPPQRGSPADSAPLRRPFCERAGSMDEVALLARRRLEEKFRRFDAAASPPPSSHHHRLSRWLRHIVGEGVVETPIQAKDAKSTEGILRPRRSRGPSRIDVCAVCLDDIVVGPENPPGTRVILLPCSHKYHSECLIPWISVHSNCPCCRTVVPSSNFLSSRRV